MPQYLVRRTWYIWQRAAGGSSAGLKTGDTLDCKTRRRNDTAMAVGSDQLFVVEGGSVRSLDLAPEDSCGKPQWRNTSARLWFSTIP